MSSRAEELFGPCVQNFAQPDLRMVVTNRTLAVCRGFVVSGTMSIMNYELEISKSKPAVFDSLDGPRLPPLVSGSGTSSLLTSSLTKPFEAYRAGFESASFTLEVWFYPLPSTGELVVVGHSGEGVLWDGSEFILRIKMAGGVLEERWRPSQTKAFHVVLVYTPGAARLYVDGAPVAGLELPRESFTNTTASISINIGGSGVYDSLALYYRALSANEIRDHYSWGNDIPDATQIAMQLGGAAWSLSYADVNVIESFVYDEDNFDLGHSEGVAVADGRLIAEDGAGTWKHAIALSALTGETTAGIHVTYEGQGAVFSYSLNGTAWIPVASKRTILEDATASPSLMLRLELDDDAWVSELRLDVLGDRVMTPLSGNRALKFKGVSMSQSAGNQLDYESDAGATLHNGYLEIDLDRLDSPSTIKTVEFWYRKTTDANQLILDAGSARVRINDRTVSYSGAPVKINGATITNGVHQIDLNVWNHFQVAYSTPANVVTRIGQQKDGQFPGEGSIYGLAVYSDVPANSYSRSIGAPSLRVNDSGGITVTESDPTVSIYSNSWSYISGGQ